MMDQPEDHSSTASLPTVTSVRTMWLVKFGAFLIVGVGLGLWGVYDLVSAYPARGEKHAAYVLDQYLNEAQKANQLISNRVSVEDPQQVRLELIEKQDRAKREGTPDLDEVERALLSWLTALSRLQSMGLSTSLDPLQANNSELEPLSGVPMIDTGRLDNDGNPIMRPDFHALAQQTTIGNPSKLRRELNDVWQRQDVPKPLSAFDMPSQWLFVVGGLVIVVWITPMILKVLSTKHRFDPETSTVTLAGGTKISPENLKDVDGRKWDKWFLYVTLDGQSDEVLLDLYRHVPLEQWVEGIAKQNGIAWPGDKGKPELPAEPAGTTEEEELDAVDQPAQ